MKQNRNLSGIIDTIQDEGPSPSLISRLPEPDYDAPAGAYATGGRRIPAPGHGLIRWLSFALLLLVIVGGAVGVVWQFFPGPSEGDTVNSAITDDWPPLHGRSEEMAVSPPGFTVSQAPDAATPLQEIQATQAQISALLDELAAAVVDDRSKNAARWAENEISMNELRDTQRKELDRLSASIATLQARLGKTNTAATASPVVPAPAPQAVATEPAVGDGEWVVNLVTSHQEKPTRDMMSNLQQQGIAVVLRTETVSGKTRYRLQVPGFATSSEARRYARKLNSEYGLKDAWPSRK